MSRIFGFALAFLALVAAPATKAAFVDFHTSGWEYEVQSGIVPTLQNIVTTGDTTSFLLKADFGNTTDRVIIRFRTKAATSERERFFMMDLELQHSVAWADVEIELTDNLLVKQGIGDRFHPDAAHIHVVHGVGGGSNHDGLTPTPKIADGVAAVLYSGFLAKNNAWEPERLRLHDMSSTAYDAVIGDGSNRKGPMDFFLEIGPSFHVPETANTGLLLGLAICGLILRSRKGR